MTKTCIAALLAIVTVSSIAVNAQAIEGPVIEKDLGEMAVEEVEAACGDKAFEGDAQCEVFCPILDTLPIWDCACVDGTCACRAPT